MPQRLPLFPLGLVLFPGVVLPLHVFEERYRAMIRALLDRPDGEREFGVVAIRQGHEVGAHGVAALHEVGCTARLRRVEPYDDGRFDIVTTGATRFRLVGVVDDEPYPVGLVEWIGEQVGPRDEAELVGSAVRAAFLDYLLALAEAGTEAVELPDLPADDLVLSYVVASTMILDLDDQQSLLAATDAVSRLRTERSLLRREVGLLRELSAAPAPELARTPISLN